MKYLFLGTPEFSAIILEKLIKAGLAPEAVICNQDKPVGRKQILTPPPVKILAQKHGLTVYQPKDKSKLKELMEELRPDLAVLAAFGMILEKEVLEIPRLGIVNVHPSLLPRWRGASPIQAAILAGDEKTGATLFLIDEKIDHGPILAKSEIRISKFETYDSLLRKLAEAGANSLIETMPRFIKGKITPLPQEESGVTYAKKIETEDAFIEPETLSIAQEKDGNETVEIDRKIRALNPEPGAWTLKDGKRMKLLEAEILPDGKLKLKKIQIEGKKPIVYN